MSEPEPQPAAPPPSPPFQFSLRTLLLLFVVLGSSLAVFGAWGIVVFGLVVGLAIYRSSSRILVGRWACLALVVLCLIVVSIGLLLPAVDSVREASLAVRHAPTT